MGARRFDVLPLGDGWWLTDSGALGQAFATSGAAIDEAKRLADLRSFPSAVFLWNQGAAVEVYHTAPAALPTAEPSGPGT